MIQKPALQNYFTWTFLVPQCQSISMVLGTVECSLCQSLTKSTDLVSTCVKFNPYSCIIQNERAKLSGLRYLETTPLLPASSAVLSQFACMMCARRFQHNYVYWKSSCQYPQPHPTCHWAPSTPKHHLISDYICDSLIPQRNSPKKEWPQHGFFLLLHIVSGHSVSSPFLFQALLNFVDPFVLVSTCYFILNTLMHSHIAIISYYISKVSQNYPF